MPNYIKKVKLPNENEARIVKDPNAAIGTSTTPTVSDAIVTFSGTDPKQLKSSNVAIEKNTNFSDTSDAKIPTSKSIANNVADKAKLTNYTAGAGTSFQTIDPTTDKVTDAIEKVQNNALFNKTNILSMWDTGFAQKNLWSMSLSQERTAWHATYNLTGETISVTSDGTWAFVRNDFSLPSGTYVCSATISNRSGSNVTSVAICTDAQGSNSLGYKDFTANGNINFEFTTTGGTIYLFFKVSGSTDADATTYTASDIMICTKSQFDISPTYQPYSLPNTAITPELIELVDSGAKNVLDWVNTTQISKTSSTVSSKTDDGVIVSTSASATWQHVDYPVKLKAGTYRLSATISSSDFATNTMGALLVASTYSGTINALGHRADLYGNGKVDTDVVIPSDGTYYIIISQNWSGTANSTNVMIVSNLMICTQAAWNVSHKYVQYRPNWDLVGKKTTLSNQCIAGNLSEFKFDISDYNSGAGTTSTRYRHGLLVGGTNANDPLLYHLFIDNNNVPTLTAVLAGARTFTATCSDNTLTITANNLVYGGLRLLWLD